MKPSETEGRKSETTIIERGEYTSAFPLERRKPDYYGISRPTEIY